MLLFIGSARAAWLQEQMFQYISCYSLSGLPIFAEAIEERFNTSHVTLYLNSGQYKTLGSLRFNTSHVTLYQPCRCWWEWGRSFNTSHVTLYLFKITSVGGPYTRFNTSHVTRYLEEACKKACEFMFQYISCYSLSSISGQKPQQASSFNTSHVTLYRRIHSDIWE